MNDIILQMLKRYNCETAQDYQNGLKEIIQEVALLGLWRAKFFEHALFYGGSALRILYGLPRFSEDLDFSLLKKGDHFDLKSYHQAIQTELESFGFKVQVFSKERNKESVIDSAFIKADTKIHFFMIKAPLEMMNRIQGDQVLKIKLEVDTDPPGDHGVEVRDLLNPIPFQVKTMPMPDLFAGKMHAVLARGWGDRVKGRDFYDYLWYLRTDTPLSLKHLNARLHQGGQEESHPLDENKFKQMLRAKFEDLNIEKAKTDVSPFLNQKERSSVELWSKDYFIKTIDKIKFYSI
jgi:hypothetical protein